MLTVGIIDSNPMVRKQIWKYVRQAGLSSKRVSWVTVVVEPDKTAGGFPAVCVVVDSIDFKRSDRVKIPLRKIFPNGWYLREPWWRVLKTNFIGSLKSLFNITPLDHASDIEDEGTSTDN